MFIKDIISFFSSFSVHLTSVAENAYLTLKGQCHKIFDFRFFYELVSPNPLGIPVGLFQIFSKIRGNIHSSLASAV
jgi:hypothetical protein